MNFEERARKARGRGQSVRAAVLLIEGLKRHRRTESALELLVDIYVDDLTNVGLGYDLAGAVACQPDPAATYGRFLQGLDECNKPRMARELVRAASEQGIELVWPLQSPAGDCDAPVAESAAPTDSADWEADEPLFDTAPGAPAEPSSPVHHGPTDSPPPAGRPNCAPERPRVAASQEFEVAADNRDSPPNGSVGPSVGGKPVNGQPVGKADMASDEANGSEDDIGNANPSRSKPSRSPSYVPVVLAVIVVAAAGFSIWHLCRSKAPRIGRIDQRMEHLDPAKSSTLAALFGPGAADDASNQPCAERRAFWQAAHAAEWGEASSPTASKDTPWGLAAVGVSAALGGQYEQAVRAATRLEHRYPEQLASQWARGFIAEARGRFAQAAGLYQNGRQAHPDFAPMMTGLLRIHVRQGRMAQVAGLQQRLAAASPDNPYVDMPVATPDPRTLGLSVPGDAGGDEQLAGSDDSSTADARNHGGVDQKQPGFVRAMGRLKVTVDAIHRGDMTTALDSVGTALKLAPRLGPALMVAGVLRVASFDVAGGVDAFKRVAGLAGLVARYRWMLQIAAPRALTGIGRADLAYQFVPPVMGSGEVSTAQSGDDAPALAEPVVPLAPIEDQADGNQLAALALVARAEVLSQLGYGQAASETLGLLDGVASVSARVGVQRVLVAIRRGRRRQARSTVRLLAHQSDADPAYAVFDYYIGHYRDAIDHGRRARRRPRGAGDIVALRYLVLSLAAQGRGRQALAELDRARVPLVERPTFEALRMRVLNRLGAGSESATGPYSSFVQLSPTSTDRVMDLASAAFWRHNFEAARTWSDRVLAVAADHPEANWLRALLAEVAGDDGKTDPYLRGAWRDGMNDPRLLVELGRIYLTLDHPKRAQKVFYKALLEQRTSVAAIRGLGQAYLQYDRRVGRRDLTRILKSYAGSTSFIAQAAETLKWLGVLNGSRRGQTRGVKYLERAAELIGGSADITVEQARYHQALGEVDVARSFYARALEKNATLTEARLGLARMALKQGDQAVAKTQLQRYLSGAPNDNDSTWARQALDDLLNRRSQ